MSHYRSLTRFYNNRLPKGSKKRRYVPAASTVTIFFFIFMFLLPLFTPINATGDLSSNIFFNAPPPDWKALWTLFNQHAIWDLEWYNAASTQWVSIKSALTIQKVYPKNDTCKITLIFDSPYAGNYRLTFGIDVRVKGYLTRIDKHQYQLGYDDFSIIFDWSDVLSIPNLQINHGIKRIDGEDYFWFRITRGNVQENIHIEIDPSVVFTNSNVVTYYPTDYGLLGSTTYVSGAINDVQSDDGAYMAFRSYGTSVNNLEDFVDNNSSNVDGHVGHGTSSNFTAQQDSNVLYNDTLTEVDTNSSHPEQLSYCNNYYSSSWTNPTYAYNNNTGDYASKAVSGVAWTTYHTLNLTYVTRGTQIRYWVGRSSSTYVTTMQIDIANQTGSWINIYSATPTYGSYQNCTFVFSQYTAMRFRFYNARSGYSYSAYIYETQGVNATVFANYELDYEFQWTPASFSEANEYLCIRTGTYTNIESLKVDVRSGSSWVNIIPSVTASQWNNVSIGTYLTEATITFRFLGGTETSDTSQSSWQIECSLIHTWSDSNIVEVEFTGTSDMNDWTELFWLADSCFTTTDVAVTFQLYNYVSVQYPTSGDGYIANIIGTADLSNNQTIIISPTSFRNSTDSSWRLKIKAVKLTASQFDFKVDFVDPTIIFSTVSITSIHTCPLDQRTFVIAYADETNYDVSFQIYDTNGTQILAETDADTSSGSETCTSVGVSAFNSTCFVVGWHDKGDNDATFAVYNKTGSLLSGPTDASTTLGASSWCVQVSCFNSTHFVIGWFDDVESDVTFAVYTSSSVLIAGPTDADTNAGGSHGVSVSTFNSTLFAIGWFNSTGPSMMFATYTSAGTLVAGPILIATNVNTWSYTISVSTLNSTHVVIGWFDRTAQDATFAVYNSAGTLKAGPTDADDSIGYESYSVQVSALNSTAFVISWYDAADYDLSFATYLSNGTVIASLTDIESWPTAANGPFQFQSVCSHDSATDIGIYNGNWLIAYANTTTQAIWKAFTPTGAAWDGTIPTLYSWSVTTTTTSTNASATDTWQIIVLGDPTTTTTASTSTTSGTSSTTTTSIVTSSTATATSTISTTTSQTATSCTTISSTSTSTTWTTTTLCSTSIFTSWTTTTLPTTSISTSMTCTTLPTTSTSTSLTCTTLPTTSTSTTQTTTSTTATSTSLTSTTLSAGSGFPVYGPETDAFAVGIAPERHCFYAAGRFWVFGTLTGSSELMYSSSTNGYVWDSPTGCGVYPVEGWPSCIWYDESRNKMHYVSSTYMNTAYYRMGTPEQDGTITWADANQAIWNPGSNFWVSTFGISVDTNGYPYIFCRYTNMTGGSSVGAQSWVAKSEWNNGTWSNATGYPLALETDWQSNWIGSVYPLTEGKMVAIYTNGNVFNVSYTSDGSVWSTPSTYAPGSSWTVYDYCAVTYQDSLHLSWKAQDGNMYYTNWTASGWLGSALTVYGGMTTGSYGQAPVLILPSKMSTNLIYIIWQNQTANAFWYKCYDLDTYTLDTNPTTLFYDYDGFTQLNDFCGSFSDYNGAYNIVYLVGGNATAGNHAVKHYFVQLLEVGVWTTSTLSTTSTTTTCTTLSTTSISTSITTTILPSTTISTSLTCTTLETTSTSTSWTTTTLGTTSTSTSLTCTTLPTTSISTSLTCTTLPTTSTSTSWTTTTTETTSVSTSLTCTTLPTTSTSTSWTTTTTGTTSTSTSVTCTTLGTTSTSTSWTTTTTETSTTSTSTSVTCTTLPTTSTSTSWTTTTTETTSVSTSLTCTTLPTTSTSTSWTTTTFPTTSTSVSLTCTTLPSTSVSTSMTTTTTETTSTSTSVTCTSLTTTSSTTTCTTTSFTSISTSQTTTTTETTSTSTTLTCSSLTSTSLSTSWTTSTTETTSISTSVTCTTLPITSTSTSWTTTTLPTTSTSTSVTSTTTETTSTSVSISLTCTTLPTTSTSISWTTTTTATTSVSTSVTCTTLPTTSTSTSWTTTTTGTTSTSTSLTCTTLGTTSTSTSSTCTTTESSSTSTSTSVTCTTLPTTSISTSWTTTTIPTTSVSTSVTCTTFPTTSTSTSWTTTEITSTSVSTSLTCTTLPITSIETSVTCTTLPTTSTSTSLTTTTTGTTSISTSWTTTTYPTTSTSTSLTCTTLPTTSISTSLTTTTTASTSTSISVTTYPTTSTSTSLTCTTTETTLTSTNITTTTFLSISSSTFTTTIETTSLSTTCTTTGFTETSLTLSTTVSTFTESHMTLTTSTRISTLSFSSQTSMTMAVTTETWTFTQVIRSPGPGVNFLTVKVTNWLGTPIGNILVQIRGYAYNDTYQQSTDKDGYAYFQIPSGLYDVWAYITGNKALYSTAYQPGNMVALQYTWYLVLEDFMLWTPLLLPNWLIIAIAVIIAAVVAYLLLKSA